MNEESELIRCRYIISQIEFEFNGTERNIPAYLPLNCFLVKEETNFGWGNFAEIWSRIHTNGCAQLDETLKTIQFDDDLVKKLLPHHIFTTSHLFEKRARLIWQTGRLYDNTLVLIKWNITTLFGAKLSVRSESVAAAIVVFEAIKYWATQP